MKSIHFVSLTHDGNIVVIIMPIKQIWIWERESMKEGEQKMLNFSPLPSLFPAHVQLLTTLTTPPGWRQRQRDRRQGRTRRYFIKHPTLTLCSPQRTNLWMSRAGGRILRSQNLRIFQLFLLFNQKTVS